MLIFILRKLQADGPSLFKALFSAGLLGGAAVVITMASVAPAKANGDHSEFGSAIDFKWSTEGSTVTVSYIPTIEFKGFAAIPATSVDINLRSLDASNLRLFGQLAYLYKGGDINVFVDVPVPGYSSDAAKWGAGLTLPFDQDGLTGSLELITTGKFDEGASSDEPSGAMIKLKLGIPGGFELNTLIEFDERDGLGVKKLGIGQELILNSQSFRLGLNVPIDFFLSGSQAGSPPLAPSIPGLDYIEPEGFFHTKETGYVYAGRGNLAPTQEFGLTTTNVLRPSVPGAFPVLGICAAFSFSRKLRKRIKNPQPEVISTSAI
jgi:hypothetical protein